jgi:glyoxylase-like metal-dependent hydrolase (beta-lactamase superfamily II)
VVVGAGPGSLVGRVHRIAVPTPFPVGPVNCWLVEGRPLTLVDTGPLAAEALAALEAGLAAHGRRIGDLERLVVTHGHIDHFGLAATLKQRSSARLFLFADERRLVESFRATHERMFERYSRLSLKAGFPEELLESSRRYFDVFFALAQDVPVDHVLADGDELDSGVGPLSVIHCPGHTQGSISLFHPASRSLFSGDNLLKDITTNPFFGGSARTKVGLTHYLPTLRRLGELDVDRVLPGHGDEITDTAGLLARMRLHHSRRGALILDSLAGGPRRPYDVMRHLFPRLPPTEVWLALADTMGHLVVLAAEGWVRELDRGGRQLFELTGIRPAASALLADGPGGRCS